jgi:hypothetical protein
VKRKFLGQVRIPDSDLYNLFEAVFKNPEWTSPYFVISKFITEKSKKIPG